MRKPANKDPSPLTIHIKRIAVSSDHIRKTVSDIGCLKATIADVGLLQPILVRQTDTGYTVIDGARRLKALIALGIEELVIGKDIIIEAGETEADETFKQLIANVQREDINDIELGHAFVILKEHFEYQYKEIAEILGKTSHYVSAKVGLAKRLTPEVQALVIKDWEAENCTPTTFPDDDRVESPYAMNINILEDIARLPQELQKAAYETVKEREMDKKEARKYLQAARQDAEVLKLADDVKGLMQACADGDRGNTDKPEKELKKHLKNLNREVEKLSVTIKAGNGIDHQKIVPALEALIERLNMLYVEVRNEEGITGASVQ